jgi:hypothetical protein
MTTRQKVDALIAAVRETPKADHMGELDELVELLNIATGLFGRDPLELLLPKSDAEMDVFVDKTIALLLQIRGDDLPPFDLARVELGE